MGGAESWRALWRFGGRREEGGWGAERGSEREALCGGREKGAMWGRGDGDRMGGDVVRPGWVLR